MNNSPIHITSLSQYLTLARLLHFDTVLATVYFCDAIVLAVATSLPSSSSSSSSFFTSSSPIGNSNHSDTSLMNTATSFVEGFRSITRFCKQIRPTAISNALSLSITRSRNRNCSTSMQYKTGVMLSSAISLLLEDFDSTMLFIIQSSSSSNELTAKLVLLNAILEVKQAISEVAVMAGLQPSVMRSSMNMAAEWMISSSLLHMLSLTQVIPTPTPTPIPTPIPIHNHHNHYNHQQQLNRNNSNNSNSHILPNEGGYSKEMSRNRRKNGKIGCLPEYDMYTEPGLFLQSETFLFFFSSLLKHLMYVLLFQFISTL